MNGGFPKLAAGDSVDARQYAALAVFDAMRRAKPGTPG